MNGRLAVIGFASMAGTVAGQVSFQGIDPGAAFTPVVTAAVSPNGQHVAGYFGFGYDEQAFRWSPGVGAIPLSAEAPLGSTDPQAEAHAVGNDGRAFGLRAYTFRVFGTFTWRAMIPTVWPRQGLSSFLEMFPNGPVAYHHSVQAVSDAGDICVGWTDSPDNHPHAVRWAKGSIERLDQSLTTTTSSADGISGNGLVIVGSVGPAETSAYLWTMEHGVQLLLPVGGAVQSGATDASFDGSAIVGWSGNNAVRWVGGQPQVLGAGRALGVSGDGSTVVGGNGNAFLWTPATGTVDVQAYLENLGVDLTDWTLDSATGVSADGKAIVGIGSYQSQYRVWLARIAVSVAPTGKAD